MTESDTNLSMNDYHDVFSQLFQFQKDVFSPLPEGHFTRSSPHALESVQKGLATHVVTNEQ